MSFKKKNYIITHNLSFDGPRFYDAITLCCLESDFSKVVDGVIDTLCVIKKDTSRKCKGKYMIMGLADGLNSSSVNTHNAINDVKILRIILKKCQISKESLINSANNYCEQTRKWNKQTPKNRSPDFGRTKRRDR